MLVFLSAYTSLLTSFALRSERGRVVPGWGMMRHSFGDLVVRELEEEGVG